MSEVDDGDDGYDELDDADGSGRPRRELTPAQRRARRQTITLLLVSGLLLVGFLFAAAYYEGWFSDGKTAAGPTCQTPVVSKVKPSQVRLNVYNASNRTGLAKRVGSDMKDRGFAVGKIENDPLHAKFTESAQVRYGSKGKAGARLVSTEVSGAKLVADKRKDASVDLVLGQRYTSLVAENASPAPTCSATPSGTTTTTGKATTKSTAKPSGTKTKK